MKTFQRRYSQELKDAAHFRYRRWRFDFYFCPHIPDSSLIVLTMSCQSQLNMQEEQYTFGGESCDGYTLEQLNEYINKGSFAMIFC